LDCQKGTLKNRQPGKSLLDCFEATVNSQLADVRNTAGKLAQNALYDNNNIKTMVLAGSKGSMLNISQISACVGQQNVMGQRIPPYFNKRTIPHFCRDDLGPEARGFASNS
jgi:DNA-directed RNA polymerase II subunit RPB1